MNIKNQPRPGTLVKPPVYRRNTVREYMVLVGLFPLQYVALLTMFSEILEMAKHHKQVQPS